MSLVNTETGEVLDSAAAERRAERVRLRLDAIADNYQAVLPMIREAIEKRDDLALGYRSPGEYVADRFGGALENLGIEVRREVVRELTEAGMSTRAIAPVVGVSVGTIHADRQVFSPEHLPEPPQAGGAATAVSSAPAVEPVPTVVGATPAPRPAVVGIDGKSYTRPERTNKRTPSVASRRTDVVQVINALILRAEQLSVQAEQIRPEHLRNRQEEAAAWSRRLRTALAGIEGLARNLEGISR